MNCLLKIKQIYEEFTTTEKKIADLIICEPELAIGFTTHKLAEYSDTSPASVIRFSKKIGFESYGAMKIELARNIEASPVPEIGTLLRTEDSLELVTKKIIRNIQVTLENTFELMEFQNVLKAVDAIKKAEVVYLIGVGASGIVAQDLQQKLVRINKRCIYYMDYHLGVAGSMHIQKEDVVIAFSYGGQTKEVNEAVRQARDNGAICIGITTCLTNPLHSLVDILIALPNTEQGIRIGAVQSRYTQLLVVDILFAGIAKGDFNVTEEYLIKTRKLIESIK